MTETKCMRCEKVITEGEFRLNQGYCAICWNRMQFYLATAEDEANETAGLAQAE